MEAMLSWPQAFITPDILMSIPSCATVQQDLQCWDNRIPYFHRHPLKTDVSLVMLAAGIHTARYLDVQGLIEQGLGIFLESYFFQELCGTGTPCDTKVTSIGA